MPLVPQLSRILNYGMMGVSVVFAYLLYSLVNEGKAGTLGMIMFGVLALTVLLVSGVLEYKKLSVHSNRPGHGIILGNEAAAAFDDGGATTNALDGNWSVQWFEDLDGNKPYTVKDSAGQSVAYPSESGRLRVQGALIGVELTYSLALSDADKIKYWFEGRISHSNDHITLIYWKPSRPDIRHAVGVVFLRVKKPQQGNPQQMEGTWVGCTRANDVRYGKCIWTMTKT